MLMCSTHVMDHKRKATHFPEGIPVVKKMRGVEEKLSDTDCNYISGKMAQPRTNGTPGDHIRRVASLNAQLALHFLLSESPPSSPARSGGNLVPGHGESSLVDHSVCISSESPYPDVCSSTLEDVPNMHNGTAKRKPSESSEDCPMSPLSDIKLEGRSPRVGSPKLMEPTVNLVDCKRKVTSLAKRLPPPSTTSHSSTKIDSSGYVKRMASLNARACVAVLMENERRYLKPKLMGSLEKEMQQRSVSNSPPLCVPEECISPQSPASPVVGTLHHPGEVITDRDGLSDLSETSVPENQSNDANCRSSAEAKSSDQDLEEASFNTLGLLYNGDTVHPHACIFLSSDWKIPERIIPVVVPAKADMLSSAIKLGREQHRQNRKKFKQVKDSNGWMPLGKPIKTVEYKQGSTKTFRKYYIGIKRRHEEIYVRDCVAVKSGRKKPYIAKVASLWQETGGVMMSLFWYYRPEDAKGTNISDYHESEVLASQHHDDNSVACIEDKAYVLGCRQFCRYEARAKRNAEGLQYSALIEQDSTKEEDVDPSLPPKDVQSLLVFFCYRGYNHIAEKALRASK